MTDTTIQLGELTIHEPMTVLTDLMITGLCFYFAYRITEREAAAVNWRLFFLFFGLSTLTGAGSHAFFPIHDGIAYKSWWLPMQVVNGIAVYCAQLAMTNSLLRPERRNFWRLLFTLQLSLFIILVPVLQNFLLVVINNAVSLIPIMIVHFRKPRHNGDKLIAWGIVISFLTGIIHALKISLHAYFNYNDIAHVFIMASLSVMFLGILKQIRQL